MARRIFPKREGTGAIGFAVTGMDEVESTLENATNRLEKTAARSLHKSGEIIMNDSMENYVPVATGALRGTGYVEPPDFGRGEIVVEMGFGGPAAPYALKVHENPRAGKTKGVSPQGIEYPTTETGKPTWATHGEWKYLEKPVKKHKDDVEKRLFSDIDNLFGEG